MASMSYPTGSARQHDTVMKMNATLSILTRQNVTGRKERFCTIWEIRYWKLWINPWKTKQYIYRPSQRSHLGTCKIDPFPRQSVFNIGDYGAADGAASMTFIWDLIVTLREHHGPEVQFQVIYEDQDINDFNSLFKRLMGKISDPPSYMLDLNYVYPLASGIEFFKQCVPSDSMHFIMTALAVQWLSKPVTYKESLWVYPDSSEEEKEAVIEQGRLDWESFLLLRSRELKQGGLLFVISSGEYEDDNREIQFTLKIIQYIMLDIWRSFRDSGKITTQEFINTNHNTCLVNLKHLKSPFDDQNSPVYQSGLRLLSAELITVKCVFYNAWKEKKEVTGIDDRQEFARNYVAAHRNWGNNTFLSGLSEDRTQQEKEKIVDDLYAEVESIIGQRNPEEFKDDIVLSYVVIKKE